MTLRRAWLLLLLELVLPLLLGSEFSPELLAEGVSALLVTFAHLGALLPDGRRLATIQRGGVGNCGSVVGSLGRL